MNSKRKGVGCVAFKVLAKQSRLENPPQWMVFSSKLSRASDVVRWSGERKELLSVSVAAGRVY